MTAAGVAGLRRGPANRENAGWGDPAFDVVGWMTHAAYVDVSLERWDWVVDEYRGLVCPGAECDTAHAQGDEQADEKKFKHECIQVNALVVSTAYVLPVRRQ